MTGTKKKDIIVLYKVLYIYSPVQFRKKGKDINKALTNCESEINAMIQVYTKQLGLQIWYTNDGAQKIDDLSLKTFKIIIASF